MAKDIYLRDIIIVKSIKITNYILVLFFHFSFSQDEANIWYFGEYAGLDFNTGNSVPLLDSQMNTEEGSAVMSDANGNLLFYTNGITIWNKQHQVMLNGTGLNGNTSSFQSSIIVPKPDNPNNYYVFTTDSDNLTNGLQYSEVDMTLDNGLGGVTSNKNILLHTAVPEFLAATKNRNANEYWVVSHKWNSNEFITYNISENGVNETPVISSIGAYIAGTGFQGSIKISPDGTKLAMGSVHVALQLFDFDSATGIISNPVTLGDSPIYSGLAFSPNSKILYAVEDSNIYQYNLQPESVIEIADTRRKINQNRDSCIQNNECIFGAQLAPDGRIYFAKRNSSHLSLINQPNNSFFPEFKENHLFLNGRKSREGLPNFVSVFLRDGIKFENLCYGSMTQFSLINSRTFDNILWNFGDPASGIDNTSTEVSPNHIFSAPGTYEVSAIINNGNGSQTITLSQTVIIYNTPIAYQVEDLYTCNGQSFDLSIQNPLILNGQSPSETRLTYHLSPIDANNGVNSINTDFISTSNPQSIYARLEGTDFPYCYDITSFQLHQIDDFPATLIPQTWYLCENENLEIIVDQGYDSYLWSTGETSSSIIVDSPGNYTVTITNNYGDFSTCSVTKTINVISIGEANIIEIETIDLTSGSGTIIINVEGNENYEYSIDGITFQDSNQFNSLQAGEYKVYIRDKFGCRITSETVFLLGYPKYFTPNGDGNHDQWQIINGFTESSNIVYIFNRYGKLLKQLNSIDFTWDGTHNGTPMPTSDYWFVLERQNGKKFSGHFTLKR